MSHPSKRKGTTLETLAERKLKTIWPSIKRTGSTAYTESAPDLANFNNNVVVQCKYRITTWVGALYAKLRKASPHSQLHLVVTRDRYQPVLVTLPLDEFIKLVGREPGGDC